MTLPHLLELAKQGNPQAIAELMNLALQPKGITAETQLNGDCLEVFLNSSRLLNSKAMVSFVSKGLANLGRQSIDRVKVYGQQTGANAPMWVEEFRLSPQGTPELVTPTLPAWETPVSKPPVALVRTPRVRRAKSPLRHVEAVARVFLIRLKGQLEQLLDSAERATSQVHLPAQVVPARVRSSKYFRAIAIASLPAFLIGATAGVISFFADGGSTQSQASITSNQLSNAPNASPEQLAQQAEVRKYLDKMNKAQRDFYAKNGRFASSLEELERSAAMISLLSQENDYTYKLTVVKGTQSQLTATPKVEGLKSFTGLVVATNAGSSTGKAATTICESIQPSKTAPVIEVPESKAVQCPADATKIS